MIGLGTLINTGAIILGGLLGLVFKKLFNEKLQKTLATSIGVCVIMIGISGVLKEIFGVINGNGLSSNYMLVLILSLVLGSLVGELVNIEGNIEKFGNFLRRISKSEGDNTFTEGFLTASFTVCIGAMAITGAIKDGLTGDYSILLAKSLLDVVSVTIMTASLGKGCIFSAIPVLLWQGLITILAVVVEPWITAQALSNLDLCGSALIFCVGVNLIWPKKISVANMLPSLVFAVIFAFLI